MTTIAWDGITMVGDSRCCINDVIVADQQKVFDLGRFGVLGFSGDMSYLYSFIKWLEDGRPDEAKDVNFGEFRAMLVLPEYVHYFGYNKVPEVWERDQKFAIGSGWTFAMAALDFGKTAKEAVEYAATKDVFTSSVTTSITPPSC